MCKNPAFPRFSAALRAENLVRAFAQTTKTTTIKG
jgi:hypothetical protein